MLLLACLLGQKRETITHPCWLPFCHRIFFKTLLLTFKSLNRLAPSYLSELLFMHTPVRELRSATQLLLDKPQTRLVTRGDRAFAVAAPNLRNNLPLHIRFAPSLTHFKSLLRTHLFSQAFSLSMFQHS